MDFKPKSHEKIQLLLDKGVNIPNPATLDIGDDVHIDQISAKGTTIYPGCRIYGGKPSSRPTVNWGTKRR